MKYDEIIEVDLTDMLCMLCGHWKSILCTALLGAVLAAGIGKWSTKDVNITDTKETIAIQETVDEKDTITENTKEALQEELYTSYQNRIAASWEQYEACRRYLERSPLQQMDAENVCQQKNLYVISADDAKQAAYRVSLLQEAYQDMLSDDELYDALQSAVQLDTDRSFLGELISIEQRRMAEPSIYAGISDSMYQIPDSAPGIMSIRIWGGSRQECESMGRAVDEVLQTYHARLCQQIGDHTLEKLSVSARMIRKPDIIQTRLDKRQEMGECLKNIEDLENKLEALEKEQAVWKKENGVKKVYDIKWLLALGGVAGCIAGCAYFGICYLFDGKMHDPSLLSVFAGKQCYGMQGIASKKNRLCRWQMRCGREKLPVREMDELLALAEKELQLLHGEKKRLAFVSTMQSAEYTAFAEKLQLIGKSLGAELDFYTGDAYLAECLDRISSADGVIWMEQKDVSRNVQIQKIGELCGQHQVPVVMSMCVL